MAFRGCWECVLNLLNSLLTITGLAMVGYGVYLLVQFGKAPNNSLTIATVSDDQNYLLLGRPMLMVLPLSKKFFDDLPKAWYER
ncbi:unnamed protein product [Lathyrus sativus]|nr:unnamed protein product [Lathyrus sativus]